MEASCFKKEELFKLAYKAEVSEFKEYVETFCGSNNDWLDYYHQKSGDTVLSFATRGGNIEILIFLREQGQDFEQANFAGKRALHEAAQFSNLACVHYLVEHGAVVDALKQADW